MVCIIYINHSITWFLSFLVILWPLLFALCGIGVFAFVLATHPIEKASPYNVIGLISMLLPLVPLVSSFFVVASGSKKTANVHFWIVVAVSALLACLILTNDRVVDSEEVESFANGFSYLNAVELLTDFTLGALLITILLGVLGAAFTQSYIKKLDVPPMPINA